MTKWLKIFTQTPRLSSESVAEYCERISVDVGHTQDDTRRNYQRNFQKLQFVTVKKTLDDQGKVITEVQKRQPLGAQEFELPIHRVSTNRATGQQWVIQQRSADTKIELSASDIRKALKGLKLPNKTYKPPASFTKKRVSNIVTDAHAGMKIDNTIYDYVWDKNTLEQAFDLNLNHLLTTVDAANGVDEVILYDLGDTLDGYDKMTTRGGHELPQNLSSEDQFAVILNHRLAQIDALLKSKAVNKIILYNVVNDNHGGSFNKSLSLTLEVVVPRIFPGAHIEIKTQKKFLDYVIYGNNCTVLTHGKDEKYMKQPMPYVLNAKWQTYIDSYLKHLNLLQYKVEVWKGDQHRQGLSNHGLFKYRNFKAFSPPSGWAQHNFEHISDVGYTIITHNEHAVENISDVNFVDVLWTNR